MGLFQFFKKTPVGKDGALTGSGSDPAVRLFQEQAMDEIVKLLTRLPDPDEVLKKAGVPRHRLNVLLFDDEISQACETRLDALLTVPAHVYKAEGEAGADKAVELMTLLQPHLENIQSGAWQARLFGYSVMEAVYQQREDGLIGLSFIGEKPMEWFEPKSDGTLAYFPSDGSGGGTGIIVDQEYKFFMTRCKATYRNPYGEALLSRLYWAWYFRTNGWKFWGKFLERFGQPLLVGKSTDPTKMVNALLMAHVNAVIGVGRDDSVEAVGVPAGNSGQTFEVFEQAAIRRIQKVVLGQTLTSGTDGAGSRALGQVHDAVRMDKRDSDISLTQPTVQRVIDALCKLNGWPRHEIEFADSTGLAKDRSERDKNLYAVGVRFTPGYITSNYDLDTEDFTLTSGASQADAGATPPPPQADDSTKQQGAYLKVAGRASVSFSKGKRRFTKHQQQVEDVADAAQKAELQPLDPAKVRQAVLAATSPEDLSERLFALIGDEVTKPEFQQALEQALFAADVLGYVAAEEQSA